MRSRDEFDAVQRLIAAGVNDCAIARQTGIPRPTVRDWRTRRPRALRPNTSTSPCGIDHDFSALTANAYSYLLGLYLGDGCISRHPRAWCLRISLDTKYPGIIDCCRQAIDLLMPGQRAAIIQQPGNCVQVTHYSKHWPCLFPQHGPGLKHNRRIVLKGWQERIVLDEQPGMLLRGLVHSDGCRVLNWVNGTAYPRYHFSNRSDDIRAIFAEACRRLGIACRSNNRWNLSVARRDSVAKLDKFVGPKA